MFRSVFLTFLLLFSHSDGFCETKKTIAIFTPPEQGKRPWDADSVAAGVSGSEETCIYMSEELANLGYQVLVLGNPPSDSVHSLERANPRYVPLNCDEQQHFDIAISWKMPEAAAKLRKRADKVYLWICDTCHNHLDQKDIDGFDDVLWLSSWQREQWVFVNPGFKKFTHIFGQGIHPKQFKEVKERANPYSCIYGSNYGRGLELLLNIWPAVHHQFPQATLDIYSGWKHSELITKEREQKIKEQLALLAPLGVQEHGLVGHDELTRAYEKASFWTYPCTVPECFSITGVRAQLAGAVPVIIEDTGLKETVRYGYKCLRQDEYLNTLLQAMREAEKIPLDYRKEMGGFILQDYTWTNVAKKWHALFIQSLSEQKKTE